MSIQDPFFIISVCTGILALLRIGKSYRVFLPARSIFLQCLLCISWQLMGFEWDWIYPVSLGIGSLILLGQGFEEYEKKNRLQKSSPIISTSIILGSLISAAYVSLLTYEAHTGWEMYLTLGLTTITQIAFYLLVVVAPFFTGQPENKSNNGYEHYRSECLKLFESRIKDPFAKADLDLASYITIGDLFLESSWDAYAVKTILDGYGIHFAREAIDPSSSPTFETLGRLGKESYFRDAFGNVLDNSNNFPGLIPTSNLQHLSEYIQSKDWTVDALKGHVGETFVRNAIEAEGFEAGFPDTITQKGYDILTSKEWFLKHNLNFVSDTSLNLGTETGLGVLQVKTTLSPGEVTAHFKTYPKIPIAIPDEIYDQVDHDLYPGLLVKFSDLNITHDQIYQHTLGDMVNITNGFFGKVVSSGYETEEIKEAIDGYFGFDIPEEIAGVRIPYIGMAITAVLSARRSYAMFDKGQISGAQAFKNVGEKTVATGLKGAASFAATSFVASEVLNNAGGVSEVMSDGLSSAKDIFTGDFDFDDLEALGEVAIIIGAAYLAKKGVDYLGEIIFGDPLGDFRKAQSDFHSGVIDFANLLIDKNDAIVKAIGGKIPEYHEKRYDNLYTKYQSLQGSTNNRFPSLHKLFLEFALEKQAKILEEIMETFPKTVAGQAISSMSRIYCLCNALGDLNKAREIVLDGFQGLDEDIVKLHSNNLKLLNQANVDNVSLESIVRSMLDCEVVLFLAILAQCSARLEKNLPEFRKLAAVVEWNKTKVSRMYKKLVKEGKIAA